MTISTLVGGDQRPRPDRWLPTTPDGRARIGCLVGSRPPSPTDHEGAPVALTQTQLASALAERVEMSKADAKIVLDALEEIVLEQIAQSNKIQKQKLAHKKTAKGKKVKTGNFASLPKNQSQEPRPPPARNPATGETITIKAK